MVHLFQSTWVLMHASQYKVLRYLFGEIFIYLVKFLFIFGEILFIFGEKKLLFLVNFCPGTSGISENVHERS